MGNERRKRDAWSEERGALVGQKTREFLFLFSSLSLSSLGSPPLFTFRPPSLERFREPSKGKASQFGGPRFSLSFSLLLLP